MTGSLTRRTAAAGAASLVFAGQAMAEGDSLRSVESMTGGRVADKTGTGDRGTVNDIGIIWTPSGPIIVTAYLTGAEATPAAARDAAIATVAKHVVHALTGDGRG